MQAKSVLIHKYDNNRSRVNEVQGWMYEVQGEQVEGDRVIGL